MTRVIHLLVYSAGHRATVPNTELHVKDTEMRETLPYTGLWSGGGGGVDPHVDLFSYIVTVPWLCIGMITASEHRR